MLFVVRTVHARGWDGTRPLREQSLWPDHATFMDGLTEAGFVRLGGPLHDGSLLIVEARDEAAVRETLARDPWARGGMLAIRDLEPWEILLGELPAANREPGAPESHRAGAEGG